jgi:hypothetical protein
MSEEEDRPVIYIQPARLMFLNNRAYKLTHIY